MAETVSPKLRKQDVTLSLTTAPFRHKCELKGQPTTRVFPLWQV